MIKRFFIGLLLFIVSLLVLPIATVWGFIEILIGFFYKSRWKKALGNLGNVFLSLAIVIDKLVNVLIQFPANRWWQKNGYKFGNPKDTSIQSDNLVDFETVRKMRIFLQRSVPVQPKTS